MVHKKAELISKIGLGEGPTPALAVNSAKYWVFNGFHHFELQVLQEKITHFS
jgi:hypothetical protein